METASEKRRRISINDLKPGMYLEDVYNKEGVLLLSRKTAINSFEQIEMLRRRGVSEVFINLELGMDISTNKEAVSSSVSDSREKAYYQELVRAKEVHKKTLETAREVLNSVRMGKHFSVEFIESTAEEMVESILRNPDALVSLSQIKGYDEYTYVHSINVGILITSLAHSMGYSEELLVQCCTGGILHDIGKMRIPEPILNKQGKFTDSEFEVMKKHPEHGVEILKNSHGISDFSKSIVIEHHERYNGNGYPKGLKGKEINEIGLIAAVADVYDALTTDRVYRAAWTPQKALAMIFQGCDKDYSREIVEIFTKHLGIYPVGSFVKLVSGELGVVLRVDKGELLAPDVLILFSNGKRLAKPLEYKLKKKQKEPDGVQFIIEMSLNPKEYGVEIGDYIKGNPLE
jgi:putative nucleotidyltransferase with HDIG domain